MNREQAWAQAAFVAVEKIAQEGKEQAGSYGRMCLRLPALIQENCLCQTIAFIQAKVGVGQGTNGPKPAAYRRLLDDLGRALGCDTPGQVPLEEEARKADVSTYQRLSQEALICSVYFKRYAEAVLKVGPTDGDEETEGI